MELRRFGLIMSVVADREIRRGEEVLVSYNYNVPEVPVLVQGHLVLPPPEGAGVVRGEDPGLV